MMEKLVRDGGRARECECQWWRESKGLCVNGGLYEGEVGEDRDGGVETRLGKERSKR